ncbi:hypothetical protein TNCV_1467431 [Trichonephila clavipes]|uniref:Uncharacterized protein n=1 Tax=Trichonephila clavipes TaxID=2585209 RepID=A0A8X6RW58_TRICX|nr:hypothetical protein TNCV_1467431 [Trichonephila clavipes]
MGYNSENNVNFSKLVVEEPLYKGNTVLVLKKSNPPGIQVIGGLGLLAKRRPRVSRTRSIGLRSGEHAIHLYAVLVQLQESSSRSTV